MYEIVFAVHGEFAQLSFSFEGNRSIGTIFLISKDNGLPASGIPGTCFGTVVLADPSAKIICYSCIQGAVGAENHVDMPFFTFLIHSVVL
jgi:hypothetical protein